MVNITSFFPQSSSVHSSSKEFPVFNYLVLPINFTVLNNIIALVYQLTNSIPTSLPLFLYHYSHFSTVQL